MSLTLEVNGKKLVTSPDFTCRLHVKNPACMFDGIRGPLAADINLPKEGNRTLLAHPDRFTKIGGQDDRRYTGAVLRHCGIELITGDLIIDNTSENYSGWVQNLMGKLGEEMREKLISQMALGGEQTFTNKTNFEPLTDLWCTFPVLNTGYFSSRGKKTTNMVATVDIYGNLESQKIETERLTYLFGNEADYFVNTLGTGGIKTSAGKDGAVVVSPFLFLHQLIELLLKENQYYISDNFLRTHPELLHLCVYHTFNIIEPQTVTTIFTPMYENDKYSNKTTEQISHVVTETTWAVAPFYLKNCLPHISLRDLFVSVQNTFNVLFWFDNNFGVRIIDRESILSGDAFDLSEYQVNDWTIGERKNVCLKFSWEHDGNDAAFSDYFSSIDDIRDQIGDPVSTLADLYAIALPQIGDIRLVESEKSYYEYCQYTVSSNDTKNRPIEEDVIGWRFKSIELQNYFFNDGDRDCEEIKSIFSTLRMDSGHPVTFQTGNAKIFSTFQEKFSPRLLLYKGNNTGGDESPGGMKLEWRGNQGLLMNRWRLWLPFWANRLPVTARFRVPTRVLKHITENIYQKFRGKGGEFIIDELNADPGHDRLVIIEINGFKIEDNFWQMNPGIVVGGGDGTNTGEPFEPTLIGINKYGKPYMLDAEGKRSTTEIWSGLSQARYAKDCAVSYNPTLKQLYVGGQNGLLYIYDLTQNFKMKTVRVYNGEDDLCSVRFLEYSNNILMGRENTPHVYALPCHIDIDNYLDLTATAMVNSPCSGQAMDFINVGGFYYACTLNGELMKSNTPGTNWTELLDLKRHFTRFVVTSTHYYILETLDRPIWSTNLADWNSFDVDPNSEPEIYQGAAIGDSAIFLTSTGIYLVNDPDHIYSLGGGSVENQAIAGVYLCTEDAYGTGKIWRFSGSSFVLLHSLEAALAHLFEY